jgi:acetone carboxylase gamma subunit
MPLEYITTRELENNGKIRIAKMSEDPQAIVELTCPKCGATEKRKENWTAPFVEGEGVNKKFNVKCKCGHSFKMLKLKKEVKKKA